MVCLPYVIFVQQMGMVSGLLVLSSLSLFFNNRAWIDITAWCVDRRTWCFMNWPVTQPGNLPFQIRLDYVAVCRRLRDRVSWLYGLV
ncbi:hypothetical protein K431DRAFT_133592 [Polychaeton citri CBS 116435]|uniref:Uncharacterized protein n=1 Tax=Polychaeton citri CBS 116435 TaxID=1314669 RepID=A0A9P4QH72_9PEZI|nr:hypothetical protein K431DRAFT_133592 [Polychaeton citri CBS 116435]